MLRHHASALCVEHNPRGAVMSVLLSSSATPILDIYDGCPCRVTFSIYEHVHSRILHSYEGLTARQIPMPTSSDHRSYDLSPENLCFQPRLKSADACLDFEGSGASFSLIYIRAVCQRWQCWCQLRWMKHVPSGLRADKWRKACCTLCLGSQQTWLRKILVRFLNL